MSTSSSGCPVPLRRSRVRVPAPVTMSSAAVDRPAARAAMSAEAGPPPYQAPRRSEDSSQCLCEGGFPVTRGCYQQLYPGRTLIEEVRQTRTADDVPLDVHDFCHAARPRLVRCRRDRDSMTGGIRACAADAGAVPLVPRADSDRPEASRKGVFACEEPVGDWDLAPPGDAELLPKHIAMCLGGSRRDAQSLADLLVRATGGNQLDDLKLPWGDARRDPRKCFLHAPKLTRRASLRY